MSDTAMNDAEKQRHVQAGLARLEAISESFDQDRVEEIEHLLHAGRVAEQPWLIAGVSDGMGLHTTLAALDAGVLRYGVGIYYEPPALLETDDDGNPVSPVHYARYQNALALEEYARRSGADFQVMFADIMMAPQRGLKGDIKSDPPPFPAEIKDAFEQVRARAPREDAVFIDSVAFGKWISPREGEDKIEAPTLNFDGELVHSKTKGYHARGYEETLDTMGRNHGRLLDAMADFDWFGPAALTAFFTWAGGSQHVQALKGVYGGGALGDAKMIAERDVTAFRMNHGLELGAHAIVRLPAFLSAALMAIPGAGLFGMISRKVLAERGFYWDMPDLSVMMLESLFGPAWVRENPISQIELDSAEILFMDDIQAAVEQAHDRVAEYRASQPEDQRTDPIPVEDSRRLLKGLVPGDYIEILGRFRPDIGDDVNYRSAAPVRG